MSTRQSNQRAPRRGGLPVVIAVLAVCGAAWAAGAGALRFARALLLPKIVETQSAMVKDDAGAGGRSQVAEAHVKQIAA